MTETFSDIRKNLDSIYNNKSHQPSRVKLNPEWAKINIEKYPLRDPLDLQAYTTIYGIPVQFDEAIETYEFIYE